MSHFSVVVIGADVDGQLAGYHEFECTGRNDEYIVDVDETEKMRGDYGEHTKLFVDLPDGTRVEGSDASFYRVPTEEERKIIGPIGGTGGGGGISWTSMDWGDGEGHSTRVHDTTLGGGTEVRVNGPDAMTFREFVQYWSERPEVRADTELDTDSEHKWGYVLLGENDEVVKVVRRTNPNAKWDWYSIGGRWKGFFPLKPGTGGKLGTSGVFDNKAKAGAADQMNKGAIDFERARSEAEQEANDYFDKWEACWQGERPEAFAVIRERLMSGDEDQEGLTAAREAYHAQPAIVRAKAAKVVGFFGDIVTDTGFDRAAYVLRQRQQALVPYALVKDGKWHQKGQMGWWGMSSDEKDQGDWNEEVSRLYDDLPPDTQITLVDCHI